MTFLNDRIQLINKDHSYFRFPQLDRKLCDKIPVIFAGMFDQIMKGPFFLHEVIGFPVLHNLPFFNHNDPIVVSYRVQTVCHGQDRSLSKLFPDNSLDEGIGLWVKIGGGLVKN